MRNLNNLGDDKRLPSATERVENGRGRKNNVGFALQILQRRLASSLRLIPRSNPILGRSSPAMSRRAKARLG